MKIEIMIYVYLAICVGMIFFNIVSAVLSRLRDKRISKISKRFNTRILKELEHLEQSGNIHNSHKKYLSKKLKRIGNMRSFDIMLEREYTENPVLVQKYLHSLNGVFVSLAISYCKKEAMEAAFFPYIIKKYRILQGHSFDSMTDMLYSLLTEPSIYCRENAMQAIYTTGDTDCVLKALKIIDNPGRFYHDKLITDGLMNFDGSFSKLNTALWEAFEEFSVQMQLALLNYFRFIPDDHRDRMMKLLIDKNRDDEIRFACIRYFGKYRFDEAYQYLLEYADCRNDARWEYCAIASSALSTYPCQKTVERLKANLYHPNWYIRFNSSQSLEKMGLTYMDLIDIVEGNDRYASEILRYRFDIRDMIDEERRAVTVC